MAEISHADKAAAIADKIMNKAEDALSGLAHEMNLMKWPADFRVIMWGAVADIASSRRLEAERQEAAGSRVEG